MFVNYRIIPGFQNLFTDYLYNFGKVSEFFPADFRQKDKYPDIFNSVPEKKLNTLPDLSKIIMAQYEGLRISKQTSSNISSLPEKNTIAVLTGQQLGVFGGPMYTIYKTLTAIKLCNALKYEFSEFNFVPVFWLEADDHDFDEVKSIKMPDLNNDLSEIIYNPPIAEDAPRNSVGYIKLTKEIEDTFSALGGVLRDNEFKPSVMELLHKAYSEGNTMKDSFSRLMFDLFDEYGLILFNPQDPAVKKMLRPVFSKEIEDFRSHRSSLVQRSADLEEFYHAQVKVRPMNLFMNYENGRYALEPGETDFLLKGKRKKFTKEELMELVVNAPELFSPNVLLRPVCQDYLFPTGIYVAGPAEASYFAQASVLYKHFGLTQPVIYPRASATLIEKNINGILSKYNLHFLDFFMEEKELNSKLLRSVSDFEIDDLFTKASDNITGLIMEIGKKLTAMDQTLADPLDKTRQKLLHTLDVFKNNAVKTQERKFETAFRHLHKAKNLLLPYNNLQERELNFVYFSAKYGPDIIKWLFNEINITKFEHQIIDLS